MTTTTVVSILSLAAGFIGQGVGQGSVLGIVTVPRAWVPYLTIVATFLAGVIAALTSGATTGAAILAGFQNLIPSAAGVALAHHVGTPARTMAMRASNDNAKNTKAAA